MDCYVPNNPQFGLSLEYSGCGGLNQCCDPLQPCACLDLGLRDYREEQCCEQQQEVCCENDDLNALGESLEGVDGVGAGSGDGWPDDMGSFNLPPLELDPLPSLFPFSPCAQYK
ncbi:hypothetical protein EVAR_29953_1 [Eumeta japonica]|uniref:Uncharacterized protein n=1 Tax=Eumeta variegata TaxID=151549 RepID=A0A4C1VHD1_EUMVA|nr:hypothetical protein EVAR_29953_1 [Eumeta japonica]